MENDRTILQRRKPNAHNRKADFGIDVTYRLNNGQYKSLRFYTSFSIGRDQTCDLWQNDTVVSRQHAEVFFSGSAWCIRDLGSSNGTFVNGQRINQSRLIGRCQIGLGVEGVSVWMEPVGLDGKHSQSDEPESVTQFVKRYFDVAGDGKDDQGRVGVVQQAFQRVSKKQTLKYRGVLTTVVLLLVAVVGVSVYQHFQIKTLYAMTTDIFYTMKTLEVQLVQEEHRVAESGTDEDKVQVAQKREQLATLEAQYEQYLEQTGLFGSLSEQDRAIFKMARVFGECELNMPEGFAEEVKGYIKKWQKMNPKLEMSITRAEVYDFLPTVRKAMARHNLPLQFFYLGVTESGFQIDAIGPETRFGIAKGAWQFIPSTALRYGLKTGPLFEKREYDAADDRFDVAKSTHAAASYLKDIYATEAQASGLLVMASYNWGEHNIRRLINKMPENPKQRNFWELIKRHRIPEETYDYVLYIFAAAVIGENPELFGFDFDNPLLK